MNKHDGWVIRSNFKVPNILITDTFRTTRKKCIKDYCKEIGRTWYEHHWKRGNIECVKVKIYQVWDYGGGN